MGRGLGLRTTVGQGLGARGLVIETYATFMTNSLFFRSYKNPVTLIYMAVLIVICRSLYSSGCDSIKMWKERRNVVLEMF